MGVLKRAAKRAADVAEKVVLGDTEKQVKSVEDALKNQDKDKAVWL